MQNTKIVAFLGNKGTFSLHFRLTFTQRITSFSFVPRFLPYVIVQDRKIRMQPPKVQHFIEAATFSWIRHEGALNIHYEKICMHRDSCRVCNRYNFTKFAWPVWHASFFDIPRASAGCNTCIASPSIRECALSLPCGRLIELARIGTRSTIVEKMLLRGSIAIHSVFVVRSRFRLTALR